MEYRMRKLKCSIQCYKMEWILLYQELQKAESENAEENIQGRELKYAFLHSSSGIELVFKSRLNIEH